MQDWQDVELEEPQTIDQIITEQVRECRAGFIDRTMRKHHELREKYDDEKLASGMFSATYNSLNNYQLVIAFIAAVQKIAELEREIGQLREQQTDFRRDTNN